MEYEMRQVTYQAHGKGRYGLQYNEYYKHIANIITELNKVKQNKLDPYFKKYKGSIGRWLSELGAFRNYNYHLANQLNTPNVSNDWIILYEIWHKYNLIPEERPEWKCFCVDSPSGAAVYSIHHYGITKHKYAPRWYAAFSVNKRDNLNLFTEYPEYCATTDDKKIIDAQPNEEKYIKNILGWADKNRLRHQFDLYVGDTKVKSAYNEEEQNAKLLLGHFITCFDMLKIGGNAVVRQVTISNPFTISLLAFVCDKFEKVYIYKAMSGKQDNSDMHIICKNYTGMDPADMNILRNAHAHKYRVGNGYFNTYCLLPIEKIKEPFWQDLCPIADLYTNQKNTILKKLDIIDYYLNSNIELDKIAGKLYRHDINKKIQIQANWQEANKMLVLSRQYKLKGTNNTPRLEK